MAITYAKYSITNIGEIESAMKNALEGSGMYDSVTWSDNAKVYIKKMIKRMLNLILVQLSVFPSTQTTFPEPHIKQRQLEHSMFRFLQ